MSGKRSITQIHNEKIEDWRGRFVYYAPNNRNLEIKGDWVNLAVAVQTWMEPDEFLEVKRVEFDKK